MKTTYFASCALVAITLCSNAVANDVFVGGNVEFLAGTGEVISGGTNTSFANYANDSVTDINTELLTRGDVTVKTNVKTRVLEYGAYVNFDFNETSLGGSETPDITDNQSNTTSASSSNASLADVDAHLRIRFAHGTIRLGSDIDGLQDVEELDAITAGAKDFNSTGGFTSFTPSIESAIADHQFSQGVEEETGNLLQTSSITFTTNKINGFTAAAEITPASTDGDYDWGASLKYEGEFFRGSSIKAVVGTESSKAVLANAQISYADLTLGGVFGQDDDDDEYLGGVIAYDLGALTLSGGILGKEAVTANASELAQQQDVAFGVAYDLAPGLTLDGTVRRINRYAGTSNLESDIYVGRIKLKF